MNVAEIRGEKWIWTRSCSMRDSETCNENKTFGFNKSKDFSE